MKTKAQAFPATAIAIFILPILAATALAQGSGAWKEATIADWSFETESMVERKVYVWDSAPDRGLKFSWSGTVNAENRADGEGTLEWREGNAPDYSPEGLVFVYVGSMKDGKRSGEGKIRFANGERYSGSWSEDLPNGPGEYWFASGDYYRGNITNGRMDGEGTYVSSGTEIYEGSFANGVRHGAGTVTLAPGVEYESEWNAGTESAESQARREEAATRARIDPAIQFGLVTSLTKNESFSRETFNPLTYESYFEGGEYGFRPSSEALDSYREGGLVESAIPDIGALFFELDYENQSSSTRTIERGEVEVISSLPDLEPYIYPWYGISGIEFQLANAGWGPANNCILEFNLHRWGEKPPLSKDEKYEFRMDLGDFDKNMLKVNMRPAFEKCGVNVDAVGESMSDVMNFRHKWKKDQADPVFGRFATYTAEGTIDSASVGFHGKLSYDWTDHEGTTRRHSVLYTGFIQLIVLAEGGDEMGQHAKFDIALRPEGENYRVEFPFSERVAANQDARFGLNLNAPKSSIHHFRILLHCSDGTTLTSPACKVHLFQPRDIDAEVAAAQELGSTADGFIPSAATGSDSSPFLFPDSDLRLLTDDELSGLSSEQLWQARNEIFIRRGYIFGSDRGKKLAGQFGDLYQAKYTAAEVDGMLNSLERKNIALIQQHEAR